MTKKDSKKVQQKQESKYMSNSLLIANTIVRVLEDNKVQDVVMLDIKDKTTISEYMIIGTGTSKRHINAVSELLRLELKKLDINNIKIEGDNDSDWVLIDINNVLVHLFQKEVREFYAIEKLWA